MFGIPNYSHDLSLRISQVMDQIGVNEDIVMRRRRSWLVDESNGMLTYHVLNTDITFYNFGSQIEGTTTLGLHSDIDCLTTINNNSNKYNVIRDLSEWKHGKHNLLMIQDETISPGYCLLQVLRDDAPLPTVNEVNGLDFETIRDDRGRILLQNTPTNALVNDKYARHGPALLIEGDQGTIDADFVFAFICHFYPVQARWQRLDDHRERHWPSYDIIQYCRNQGCFVVPVGNKGSINEGCEWRISTSLAERCLMFNLNITQIRCFVLMKMIMKTFISPNYSDTISSFMCKTVLFHCISNTRADQWKDSALLACLTFCLSTLHNCVLNEYCPHFIITRNNLMLRRILQETKPSILEVLRYIIESNGRALLEIQCDQFGLRLQHNLNGFVLRSLNSASVVVAGRLLKDISMHFHKYVKFILLEVKKSSSRNAVRVLTSFVTNVLNIQHIQSDIKCFFVQHFCHTIGTILASSNIYRGDNLSYKALHFMSLGLNSDVASGKLKLASVFYCIGDTERTELILKTVEENYDLSVVEPVCRCYPFQHSSPRDKFNSLCYESDKEISLIKDITASCVRFLKCEVYCCPQELRHEMFRSTQEDFTYRGKRDEWMDMAVVDSLPYLYFLQYKTYSCLGKGQEKNKALSNLARSIEGERDLGHRETALNLLGQCMEMENLKDNALKCYMLSLRVRNRNNAAKFLTCRLLNTLINGC